MAKKQAAQPATDADEAIERKQNAREAARKKNAKQPATEHIAEGIRKADEARKAKKK